MKIKANKIQLSDHFNYRKLFLFVLSPVAMMIFTSIYGVVDGYFVSNYVGKTAFASLNVIYPFISILGGVGFMIGSGGSALVGKVLGEGDKDKANRYFSQMVILTVILGVILSGVGIAVMRPMAYLLGAEEDMVEYCVLYGRIVVSFNVVFMLQNLFQSFCVTAEKPKLGLFTVVLAGCSNMFLDWLFVAVFDMGLAGAAIATGIGQCIGGIVPLVYFLRPNKSLLRLVKAKLELRPIVDACTNGSSEFMSNIAYSLLGMMYNKQLLKMIGKDGTAAYGVLMYVQFIFIAIFLGYSIGVAPLISYNYGANNKKELKNLFKKSVIIMAVSSVILSVLAFTLAEPLAKLFVGYDEELTKLTVKGFNLSAYLFLFAGFNIFSSSLFTALNNGLISAIISFVRTLVFQTIALYVVPLIMGSDGIWFSMTVSEVFAIVVSLFFVIWKHKKYGYYGKEPLPLEPVDETQA